MSDNNTRYKPDCIETALNFAKVGAAVGAVRGATRGAAGGAAVGGVVAILPVTGGAIIGGAVGGIGARALDKDVGTGMAGGALVGGAFAGGASVVGGTVLGTVVGTAVGGVLGAGGGAIAGYGLCQLAHKEIDSGELDAKGLGWLSPSRTPEQPASTQKPPQSLGY
ncbi:MAG: hypothetical protein ACOYNL_06990 [Rickettsiales bacterium]